MYADPQCIHSLFYDAYGRSIRDCTDDFQVLRAFLPAFAAEYLLYLLFPGADETKGGVYRIGSQRTGGKRCPDLSPSGGIQRNAIWFAMPVTEVIVAFYVIHEMIKYTKQLK